MGFKKGNTASTRNKVPDKDEKILRILERKIRGDSTAEIARDEGIHWQTCEKFYQEGLRVTGLLEDIEVLVKREVLRIDRAYDKCTRDYMDGKCKAADFVAMAGLHWKLNGIDRHLGSATPEIQPPLMKLEISQVPFELPPPTKQPTESQEQ